MKTAKDPAAMEKLKGELGMGGEGNE